LQVKLISLLLSQKTLNFLTTLTEKNLITNSMYDDVARFHTEILNVSAAPSPTLVSEDWLMERFRFLTEEVNEFLEAGLRGDMVGATDGLLDTVYVALGTLHMMGVPVQACWDLVQQANMAKVRGVTKRGNAIDAVKPVGWVGPEQGIAAILGRALDEA
jgi:predicted HAD superfamily Cof-like phosphohydrolase